jgi:hypothetical protein
MKTTKSILLRFKVKGNGIVNFDSSNQKFLWNSYVTNQEQVYKDNVNFAKKRWYKNEDGSANYKIIISSNCFRHAIFIDDVMFQSPNVINNEYVLMSMIANPAMLLRGYMFAEESPALSIKRASPISITDVEQCNNALSTLETFTRSGEKTKDPNKSDITFFKKEVIGNIEYKGIGGIDLMQLQFISTDEIFDRLAFNPDNFELYKKIMQSKFPSFDGELNFYQINGSVVQIPEYGIKLSNDNVNFLVKEYFKRLLSFNIKKSSSYAMIESVEYKLVSDPLKDTMEDNNGWVNLNHESLNDLKIEMHDFYSIVDRESAKELRKEFVEKGELKKALHKKKADDKKAAKKDADDKKNIKKVQKQ